VTVWCRPDRQHRPHGFRAETLAAFRERSILYQHDLVLAALSVLWYNNAVREPPQAFPMTMAPAIRIAPTAHAAVVAGIAAVAVAAAVAAIH